MQKLRVEVQKLRDEMQKLRFEMQKLRVETQKLRVEMQKLMAERYREGQVSDVIMLVVQGTSLCRFLLPRSHCFRLLVLFKPWPLLIQTTPLSTRLISRLDHTIREENSWPFRTHVLGDVGGVCRACYRLEQNVTSRYGRESLQFEKVACPLVDSLTRACEAQQSSAIRTKTQILCPGYIVCTSVLLSILRRGLSGVRKS
jgi:hypothetical protein